MKRNLSILAAFLTMGLLASSCSCDDPGTKGQLPELKVGLSEDPSGQAKYLLEFGDVPVGSMKTSRIEITNTGAAELQLRSARLEAPFSLDVGAAGLTVAVGASEHLRFAFAPLEATEEPSETIVRLETNERSGSTSIRLVGRGVPPGLACAPAPIEFGNVVRGTEKALTVVCTNPLNTTLELASATFFGSYEKHYSVEIREGSGGVLPIPPEGEITLDLRFRAESMGPNDVVLVLRDVNKQLLADLDVKAEVVSGALKVDPPECLDFGYVDLGEMATRTLRLENVGSEPLDILGFRVPVESQGAFSVTTSAPISTTPGEEVEVEVLFHPTEAGRVSAQIDILTSDRESATVGACVTGFGGGPKIACTPSQIDFGSVSLGSPITREYACTNVGVAPPNESVDPLMVEEVFSDSDHFTAAILGPDGAPGRPRRAGYEIGEGFTVQVRFAPQDEGFLTGNISVQSNASSTPLHTTSVMGEGRSLPSCDFTIIPPSLRFGTVDRGSELVRTFTIQNHLETACLVNDLRLSEDSDPFFSVEEIDSVEIPGRGSLTVSVRFAPTEYRESVAGRVVFHISNEEQPEQSVELRGISAFPCVLVEPSPVDFGKSGVGCFTPERPVTISNACALPITITDIGVDYSEHSSDFYLQRIPELGLVLPPNRSDEFTLRFSPSALGEMNGLAYVDYRVSNGEEGTTLSPLIGWGAEDLEQTDEFQQLERPKVDVLWVIDNSGSMGRFQDLIRERLPIFTSFADEQDINYHLGVTTTGLFPTRDRCPGGALGGENGRLVPINASDWLPPIPRILTRETPRLHEIWAKIVVVGDCHGTEQPYEAALRALSPPLINEVKDSRPNQSGHPSWNDGNAGFRRPDAALSIVVMTDEIDQSFEFGKTPLGYIEAYRDVLGPRYRHLLKFSAITVPTTAHPRGTCGPNGDRGDRLMVGVEETGGVWFNICTSVNDVEAWNEGLRKISEASFAYTSRFALRGQPAGPPGGGPPTEADIVVRVNGQVVPPTNHVGTVWFYDPIANAVDFTPKNSPSPGADVTITYQVACLR